MTTQVDNPDMTELEVTAKPSGPAAAAFIAAGIGSLVMGLTATLNEIGGHDKAAGNTGSILAQLNTFLDFAKNYGLGSGVGPMSGKAILSVLAFVISWGVLFFVWRHRDISVRKAFIWTVVLVGVGFALTFPPIFYLIAGE